MAHFLDTEGNKMGLYSKNKHVSIGPNQYRTNEREGL